MLLYRWVMFVTRCYFAAEWDHMEAVSRQHSLIPSSVHTTYERPALQTSITSDQPQTIMEAESILPRQASALAESASATFSKPSSSPASR